MIEHSKANLPAVYNKSCSLEYFQYFSVCKTKVITMANQNKKYVTRTKFNTSKRPEEWENVNDQVAIGFSFESDWLRG